MLVRSFLLALLVVASSAAGAWSQRPRPAPGSSCMPSDSEAANLVEYLRTMITATDSEGVAQRRSWGLLPGAPTDVELVASENVCAQAARAYRHARRAHAPWRGERVYVVRVGPRYVVDDPAELVGEFALALVFDHRFRLVKAVIG